MNLLRNKYHKKSLFLIVRQLYHSIKHINNDLLILRHAQSFYNVASQKYIKQNHLNNLTWDEICQISDFNLDINYNSKFIDSDLSEKGVIQVIYLQENVQCFNLREEYLAQRGQVDLILCSPLLRALRTCRHVFDPLKVKKIVLPQLTQVLRYACDISDDIQQKKQQFKQLDWTLFPQNDNFWFLKTQPTKITQKIHQTLHQKQPETYKSAQYQILMLLYQQAIFQSDKDLRTRSKKVKQIINSFKHEYKNIIVISHHYLIQHLLAQGYRENHQPITGVVDQVPNATPIETNISEILSVL